MTGLGIPPHAAPAFLDLLRVLASTEAAGLRLPCEADPHAWSPDAPPSDRAAAAEACGWCPALESCAAYADAAPERWGTWGGRDRTTRPRAKQESADARR